MVIAASAAAETPSGTEKKPAAAGESSQVLTLDQCLKLSMQNHPAVLAAKYKLASMKKQLDEAHWAPFFNIGMTTILAPCSTMKGDALHSEEGGEIGDYSELGVWIRLEIQAGFPIFTFGKIKSVWKMAEEGVNIGKMELQKQVNEIEFETRRAYLTVVFARQVRAVLEEGKDYLEDAQEKIDKDLENEEGEATLTDQLKVKTYMAQVESQIIQIKKLEEIALSGLRFLTGKNAIEISEETIEVEEGSLKPLSWYVAEAKKNRPEFFILDSALKVSKANLKLAKSKFLPDFFLVGKYTYAYADKVEPQNTPFAHDPWNTNSGGVALVMNYPFDFVPNYFRTDKAKAQVLAVKAQKEAATGMFVMEVEKAYNEAKSLDESYQVLKKGKKAAKGWIVATNQNYQAGLAELKDFTDALVTYFSLTAEYYKMIYDYDVALSQLRLVTGTDKILQ